MQPDASADDGFSPLRVARARRRAGRQVALVEPDGSTAAEAHSSMNQEMQRQYVRTNSQQDSQPAGITAGSEPGHVEQEALSTQQQGQQRLEQPQPTQQPQPKQLPQQPQPTQTATPPVKRVGFSLDGMVVAAARDQPGGQQPQFSGISRRKQEQLQREVESQAKQRNKYDEKLVDVPIDVPELEEAGKEDITRVVAQAPKPTTQHIQAISELDLDQAWMPAQVPRSTDINLSLLTSCLLPSAQVIEPADVWDYSLLFAHLKAELQNEAGASADGSSSGGSAATADPS